MLATDKLRIFRGLRKLDQVVYAGDRDAEVGYSEDIQDPQYSKTAVLETVVSKTAVLKTAVPKTAVSKTAVLYNCSTQIRSTQNPQYSKTAVLQTVVSKSTVLKNRGTQNRGLKNRSTLKLQCSKSTVLKTAVSKTAVLYNCKLKIYSSQNPKYSKTAKL